ncbi:Predicted small integral membrane protein [Methylacidimicrobium sp. AP8]|uniref:DUF2165 domain-containing protein n=1 Tax=Methylacidimicrobium sp. AP8 TaxID=2730359 RepID=UPI0018BFD4EA|nr:DUF2165 domain-containing protein [Methylacidimicrobium sp. AP8]CAB4242538.1 Predicted small integral membrane protein [Methylacidimicrobium sp. AP8]
MSSSLLVLRASRTILTLLVGAYFLLAGIDNMLDPSANWPYLVHVLSMDSVPADSPLRWRALRLPAAWRLLFGGLIAWELATAFLCFLGSFRLLRAWFGTRQEFARAKSWAVAGLTCGLVQWLFFFLILAGEWFQLWRGSLSAALSVAARMFAVTALSLIYLTQEEEGLETTDGSPPKSDG